MPDQWMIKGREYGNCNCDQGCPCQFNAPSTHGHCQAVVAGIIDEGHFGDCDIAGLHWALIAKWPGEIAEGNGEIETVIDERASTAQRDALGKILKGESTTPGATIFSVLSSTMSTVHDTLYRPIDVSIDIDARQANLTIAGLVESTGTPMKNPFTGENSRAQIHLPNGFEYTYAEIGVGTSKANGSITIELSGTHGQFCVLHMNQDGVIR